jgi:hypothetical protein
MRGNPESAEPWIPNLDTHVKARIRDPLAALRAIKQKPPNVREAL